MRERSGVGGYFLDWVAREVSSEEATYRLISAG